MGKSQKPINICRLGHMSMCKRVLVSFINLLITISVQNRNKTSFFPINQSPLLIISTEQYDPYY